MQGERLEMTLYEQVADRIEGFISKGIYEPGERLPSIRRLAGQFGVSINTIREAYGLLEDRRIAQARSGSGYFVAHLPARPNADLSETLGQPSPRPVTVDEISYRVCEVVTSP
jgi:DNA-binding GntR family transcriptional regulator